MAKTENQSLLDNVRSTLTGNRGRNARGRNSRGGGLATQASGFIGGLLSGGSANSNRSRGRRRR